MNTKKKRYFAIILCIYFILMSIFSLTYMIKESDHDCLGEHCPICDSIHAAQENLERFSLAAGVSEEMAVVTIVFSIAVLFVHFVILRATPVTWKTRMDN